MSNFLKFYNWLLKLKDVFFTNPAEHLHRTVHYIHSKNINFNNHLILDIGAADGMTSLYFSDNFRNTIVHGYEAIPQMAEKALLKTKKYENIKIFSKALSDKNELVDFYVTKNRLSSSLNNISDVEILRTNEVMKNHLTITQKLNIETNTLDEFYTGKEILIIKLDTQGSELKILNGGIQTLKSTMYVLTEMSNHKIYNGGCQYYEVDEFLRSHQFRLVDIYVTYRPNGKVGEYDALYERE